MSASENITWKRVARHLWGWFTVCVWILGVPHVLKIGVQGVKIGVSDGLCTISQSLCAKGE